MSYRTCAGQGEPAVCSRVRLLGYGEPRVDASLRRRAPFRDRLRRIGGGMRAPRGRRAKHVTASNSDFQSPLSPAIEGAFFWVYGADSGICATVIGRRRRGAPRATRTRRSADADLVELRLDTMTRPDAAGRAPGAPQARDRHVPAACGGRRVRRARRGASARAARRAARSAPSSSTSSGTPAAIGLIGARGGRGVVVSRTIFDGTPTDLPALLAATAAAGAQSVAKLAVTTRTLVGSAHAARRRRDAGIDRPDRHGRAGRRHARALPDGSASRWTYAGAGVAPGQMSASRLLGEFRFRRIRPRRGALRRGRQADRPLAVARHAQRRLRARSV